MKSYDEKFIDILIKGIILLIIVWKIWKIYAVYIWWGFCPRGLLSYGAFVLGSFCPWGFCSGGGCPGGFCPTLLMKMNLENEVGSRENAGNPNKESNYHFNKVYFVISNAFISVTSKVLSFGEGLNNFKG